MPLKASLHFIGQNIRKVFLVVPNILMHLKITISVVVSGLFGLQGPRSWFKVGHRWWTLVWWWIFQLTAINKNLTTAPSIFYHMISNILFLELWLGQLWLSSVFIIWSILTSHSFSSSLSCICCSTLYMFIPHYPSGEFLLGFGKTGSSTSVYSMYLNI